MTSRTKFAALSLAVLLTTGATAAAPAFAVGEGPDYGGNETVNTSILRS